MWPKSAGFTRGFRQRPCASAVTLSKNITVLHIGRKIQTNNPDKYQVNPQDPESNPQAPETPNPRNPETPNHETPNPRTPHRSTAGPHRTTPDSRPRCSIPEKRYRRTIQINTRSPDLPNEQSNTGPHTRAEHTGPYLKKWIPGLETNVAIHTVHEESQDAHSRTPFPGNSGGRINLKLQPL